MNYTLIKSKRKTVAIQIKSDGSVILRAPLKFNKKSCDKIINENKEKIIKIIEKVKSENSVENFQKLSEESIEKYKKTAKQYIPKRVNYICQDFKNKFNIGFNFEKINITSAKGSWGSCSYRNGKNNLNFSWRLIILNDFDNSLCDYVIIHELCHIYHHNHSKEFWAMVKSLMPEFLQKKEKIKQFERKNKNIFE
ncbi:MAG: M48 family metallopeptidase [Oscillospiraceae bacterium]